MSTVQRRYDLTIPDKIVHLPCTMCIKDLSVVNTKTTTKTKAPILSTYLQNLINRNKAKTISITNSDAFKTSTATAE